MIRLYRDIDQPSSHGFGAMGGFAWCVIVVARASNNLGIHNRSFDQQIDLLGELCSIIELGLGAEFDEVSHDIELVFRGDASGRAVWVAELR